MDPAQLASEAIRRLLATQTSGTIDADEAEQRNAPLLEMFAQLGKLDGWAKIAIDRLAADPQDARAAQELRRSLEQTARLHPHFIQRLVAVVGVQPAVKTSITLPQQPSLGARTPSG
jgi:uncharacterized protein YhaN